MAGQTALPRMESDGLRESLVAQTDVSFSHRHLIPQKVELQRAARSRPAGSDLLSGIDVSLLKGSGLLGGGTSSSRRRS